MKQINLIIIFNILFLVNLPHGYGIEYEESWKAGIAKVKITPKENLWMAGYASRTTPAKGKLNDLWAKAIFLEDRDGNCALLITADLLLFHKKESDAIRDGIMNKLGLSYAQIIINCSHTHSGPVITGNYSKWIIDQIVKLAVQAKRVAKPVSIYSENGVTRFQVNRRNNVESKLEELMELKGPNDYAVPVIKVENKNGKIKAIVFGYACHANVLAGNEWSGDYPGFAQSELENKFKGATAMFFQGAGGDQNPLPRRSVALAKQYGKELAIAVERVINEDMNKLEPFLITSYSEINLKLNAPKTKDELVKIKNKTIDFEKKWAENMLLKMESGESFINEYPYPIQFWQLGEQKIISLGGELLVGYSNHLKKVLGNNIFVMGYCNDVMGYIPTEKVLQEGGYEGETSQMVYGFPSTWAPGIEDDIIKNTVKLVLQSENKIFKNSEIE